MAAVDIGLNRRSYVAKNLEASVLEKLLMFELEFDEPESASACKREEAFLDVSKQLAKPARSSLSAIVACSEPKSLQFCCSECCCLPASLSTWILTLSEKALVSLPKCEAKSVRLRL